MELVVDPLGNQVGAAGNNHDYVARPFQLVERSNRFSVLTIIPRKEMIASHEAGRYNGSETNLEGTMQFAITRCLY